MRTTVTIADDVYAEMERLRREEGLGPSEALNLLARRGMTAPRTDYVYVHRSYPLPPGCEGRPDQHRRSAGHAGPGGRVIVDANLLLHAR